MAASDLQIGDTWTHPDFRNRGLASSALKQIVDLFRIPGLRFWYVVEEENTSSIRAAEKAGFVCVGRGRKTARFGLKLLGSYVIEQPCNAKMESR